MPNNFSVHIHFDGGSAAAVIVPTLLQDGMHYEVNVAGYPRFWMKWGAMDRYELVRPRGLQLPDALVLAVSDVIEEKGRR